MVYRFSGLQMLQKRLFVQVILLLLRIQCSHENKKNRNSFFTQSSRGSAGLEIAKWPGENWKPYFLSFPPSTQFPPWLAFFVRFASFPRSRTFTSRPYIPYSKWLSGKGTHMAADKNRSWGSIPSDILWGSFVTHSFKWMRDKRTPKDVWGDATSGPVLVSCHVRALPG